MKTIRIKITKIFVRARLANLKNSLSEVFVGLSF